MKYSVRICLTAVMSLALLAGGTAQASASAPKIAALAAVTEENCISSSWKQTSSPELTSVVKALAERAFDGLTGVSYKPVALLAERTTFSGTQYRLLCRSTVITPDAEEQYTVVTLSRGWLGYTEILTISDSLCSTGFTEEAVVGGWQQPDSPVLTYEASAAFLKATELLVGVSYKPIALLSTQIVAGANYRILCEATTVYPGEKPHYAVMTLHEDFSGNTSILKISWDNFIGVAE